MSNSLLATRQMFIRACSHRLARRALVGGIAILIPISVWALNPGVPPGSNFNLTYWELQLPTGSTDNPDTISSSQLQQGYQDPNHQYFFTESGDGAMVMKVPGDTQTSGCVTTPDSLHCRTELREVNPGTGQPTSWDPNAATNRLKATLVVTAPSDQSTVIGQIHIDDNVSKKPVCELYYASNGDISIGVSEDLNGDQGTPQFLMNIPKNTQFNYEIEYSSNLLKVALSVGSDPLKFWTIGTKNLNAPKSYFKAGDYDQGTTPADVHFLALTIEH